MDSRENSSFVTLMSRMLGCVLIVSSFSHVGYWLPPRLAVISQIIAGIGVLYGRTWAFYLVYLLAASHLVGCFLPSLISTAVTLFPFAIPIAKSVNHFGIPSLYTYYLLNLLFLVAIVMTHRKLQRTGQLDWKVNNLHKRFWLRVVQIPSVVLAILGIATFAFSVYSIIWPPVDDPGGMGGGFVYAFAIFFSLPTTCVAVVLFFVTRHYLERPDLQ